MAVTEGNSGITKAVFTVTLTHAFDEAVTVRVRTKDGTAREGSDYIEIDDDGEKIFIPALSISAEVTVKVKGDKKVEADETLFVVLSSAKNAKIADGVGMGHDPERRREELKGRRAVSANRHRPD